VSGFSLWTEPWIPVQPLEGKGTKVAEDKVTKVGLFQALAEAHTLRGILDPSPLVTVALHRLLLALVYRTQPLKNFADWQAIWKAGRFQTAALAAYGEAWAERFDLLHPTRPFYQVPFMPDEKVHPVAALLLEAASGNNPALFDHGRVEGAEAIPLDRAACYLLAHQWFAIGGGVSKPFNRMDAPLTKGLVVEVIGRSLFETLLLNAMPLEHWRDLAPAMADDRPFWEEASPPEPVKEGTLVRGPLHYLTWQSRQVHLVVDADRRVVTGCQIAQRYCLPKDGGRVDPGKSYYVDEKKDSGWLPRRLQKDRAAWRLTHVLLQPTEGAKAQPQVVSWLAALRRRERMGSIALPKAVSLSVSGLTTDPKLAAKVDLWRREEIGLPLAILESDDLIRQVDRLMATAGAVEAHLRRTAEALIWALAERPHQRAALEYLWTGKTGTTKMPPTVAPVARSLGVTLRYWAAMEAPFRQALWRLPEVEPATVQAEWREALKRNARTALSAALSALQASGAPWEPLSLVEDAFGRRLTWILEKGEEDADDDRDED
jgi:CRISPR system Cascade subunit CasA